MQTTATTTFETINAHYQFLKGRILKIKHAGQSNNFELAEQNLSLLKERLNEQKYKILFDNEGFKYSGKKTHVLTMGQLDHIASALAFVAKSKTSYGLASIFATFSTAKCPIRIFKTETDALAWLDQFE